MFASLTASARAIGFALFEIRTGGIALPFEVKQFRRVIGALCDSRQWSDPNCKTVRVEPSCAAVEWPGHHFREPITKEFVSVPTPDPQREAEAAPKFGFLAGL